MVEWRSWSLPKIDLIIGGSPCQGFSFAGKNLNFYDPRSKLFFDFADILEFYKPDFFLLENVKMKRISEMVISEKLGSIYPEYATKLLFTNIIEPIEINSALVSAQNRKRLYWTNIPNVSQPKDKGIILKDIIEKQNYIDKNYYTGSYIEKDQVLEQSQLEKKCIQVGIADIKGNENIKRIYSINGKSPTLSTCQGGYRQPKIQCDNLKIIPGFETYKTKKCIKRINRNKKTLHQKASALTITSNNPTEIGCTVIKNNNITWRMLTIKECCRLQTIPDNYFKNDNGEDIISKTQQYKCLGNGWTVDVIAHILKNIKMQKWKADKL
jgi:DNA-cytosine methyltransferase